MSQLSLLAGARATDPETSHAAARGARKHAKADRQRALEALIDAGARGLTDFELGDLIGRQQTSAGKRRGELVTLGVVEWAGSWRPAPSGAKARVWRVKRGAA